MTLCLSPIISESANDGNTGNCEANHSPTGEENGEAAAAPEALASAQGEAEENGDSLGADNRDQEDVNQFTFTPGHHPKNAGESCRSMQTKI